MMNYDKKHDHGDRERMELAAQEAADTLKKNVCLWRIGDGYEMAVEGMDMRVGNVVFTAYHAEGMGDLR